jgi:hypothetical protein
MRTKTKILAIPLNDLCPHCKRGRMRAYGTKRAIVVGKFDSMVYRQCTNPACRHRAKMVVRTIGVESDS